MLVDVIFTAGAFVLAAIIMIATLAAAAGIWLLIVLIFGDRGKAQERQRQIDHKNTIWGQMIKK